MMTQTYYVGTGAKSAMFTLRVMRAGEHFARDFHLCNLTAAGDENEMRAIEKAKAYTDAMRERIGETEDFKIVFGGVWDEAINKRRGKLSVRDTHALGDIEAGKFPFGKHRGVAIDQAPMNYVLYWADLFGKHGDNQTVADALSAACQGVALDKGYIVKREEIRAERAEADAKSGHIGTIGERREFEGVVITSLFKRWFDYGPADHGYFISKVRCGDDIVSCMGSKSLGEVGQIVKFKATIKGHDEYKGVKSTKINRPTFAKVAA